MPTLLTELPRRPAPPDPPRKQWSRAECAALESSGLLDLERLELIEGELIKKVSKTRLHVNSLTLLISWLMQAFGPLFVNPEAPIDVATEDNPTNEPEPDIIVLKRELSCFLSANPQPEDLCLAVEIADTSLNYDLTTKASLYARVGIMEYWVLDVAGRRLIMHREPEAGQYTSVIAYSESESVAPLRAPQQNFLVSDAFPAL
jgi:Uma2 family endonuclease